MHEYQASLNSVTSAQALQPDFCPAFKLKGLVQRELGDFSGAETSYLAAMACAPQDADIPYNLGILYDLYIGDLEKALAQYQRSRTLRGQDDAMLAIWIPDLQRRTGVDPEAAAVATAGDAETSELQAPSATDEGVTETVQPQVAGE
jgi:tetratricopeptide (TPR) repeat protein